MSVRARDETNIDQPGSVPATTAAFAPPNADAAGAGTVTTADAEE